MTALIWSPQSQRDVESIRRYIEEDAPVYADLVVRRIVAAVEHLKMYPESGRVVPERRDPAIREVIVDPYRVVYRLRGGTVEIATVFRASRLFPTDIT